MSTQHIALVDDREVTIQALRVNGKKMTLQFFRQIPRAQYFLNEAEPDLTLSPWGRVIYQIANEGHEWLLAQREDKLLRYCIDLPSTSTSEWSIEHHTKGIADAKEKTEQYAGKVHYGPLLRGAEESFNRHTAELKLAFKRLELAKKQAAALAELQLLAQLYIA